MKIPPTGQQPAVLVFDLGGTWWRTGLLHGEREIKLLHRAPAINHHNTAKSVDALQIDLVNFIVDQTIKHAPAWECDTIGVAIGAATNGHSGEIIGSGPLWGQGTAPFNLAQSLHLALPRVSSAVINDVSAMALSLSGGAFSGRKAAVITVSSGVAYRTIDLRTGHIPLDPTYGVQGEIGHLPAEFVIAGRQVEARCECGGLNHLAAFCSGRGIAALLGDLPEASWLRARDPRELISAFAESIRDNDARAWALLDAFIRPVAKVVAHQAVLDPEIEHTVLSGGVLRGLGNDYLARMQAMLQTERPYGVPDEDYFRHRVVLATNNGVDALLGAGIYARQTHPQTDKPRSPRPTYTMKSWAVNAIQEIAYAVQQTEEVLNPHNPALARAAHLVPDASRLVVIDEQVSRIYGRQVFDYFRHHRVEPEFLVLHTGEVQKTVESLCSVVDAADAASLNRRSDPIIAIGGGVLTDVVGLASSLYRRGIPFIRVPTTLIGMVDAAVGVKTGVNFRGHKNRIGTYFPATTTLIDQRFLLTLSDRHIANGLAEIVKIAIMRDHALFELLDTNASDLIPQIRHAPVGRQIIQRAVTGMLEELEPNLWERDLQRRVDFGHTFSPKIELNIDNDLLHGEAVGIDMVLCCLLAQTRGLLAERDTARVLRLLDRIGLPLTRPGITSDDLIAGLADATQHRDGHQHLPLPAEIGRATFVEDVTPSELRCVHRMWLELDLSRERV